MPATARKLNLPTNLRTPSELIRTRPLLSDFDQDLLWAACLNIGMPHNEVEELFQKIPDNNLPTIMLIVKTLTAHPIHPITPVILINAYADQYDQVIGESK